MHMSIGRRFIQGVALVLLAGGMLAGCVQRKMTITSDPPGALVWLNGKEMGRTPLTRDFIQYGTYDVQLRKEGYETLNKPTRVIAPWWQWFPIDFVAELMPFRPTDHQHLHFSMTPRQEADSQTLLEHADQMRKMLPEAPAKAPATPAEETPATAPAQSQPDTAPADVTPAMPPVVTEPSVPAETAPAAPATEPVELNK